MKKCFFIFVFILVACLPSYAQVATPRPIGTPKPADSLDIDYYGKKYGLRATGLVVGINTGIWAFDRYILKADYAYISARTMRDNIRHGFVWDNDQMGTNMFLHPYHGSLYFNAARANGYNFWQSGLFSLGGSAMWELFMESEYPSTNDIIATPIGGMALGEMFYRVSDMILDDRQTGKHRAGREIAAFVVSPMRGLTRVINGDAWRKRTTTGRQFGMPEVSIMVSAGARAVELKDEIFDKGVGIATQVNMEYGDRFETEERKPYDYFLLNANINFHPSQPLLGQLNLVGRLLGTDIINNDKRQLSLGLYQHFDYYDSDTISDVSSKVPYKFCSPASIGAGLIYRMKTVKNWYFDSFLHLNGIILGGALSDHYKVDNRNYNLGSGFGSKLGLVFVYKKDKFIFSTNYEMYRIFTWKGYPQDIDWNNIDAKTLDAQGDVSQALLHAIGLRVDIKLRKNWYLTGMYHNYIRDTNYRHYENVFSKTSDGKLMISYLF